MVASSNPNRTDAVLYGTVPDRADVATASPDEASTRRVEDPPKTVAPEPKRKRGRPRKNVVVEGTAAQPPVKRQKARAVDTSVHEIRLTLETLRKLFIEYEKLLESGVPVDFVKLRASLGPRLEPCELSPIDLEFIVTEFTANKFRPSLGLVLMERPGSFQPSYRSLSRTDPEEVGQRLRQLWLDHKENSQVTGDDVAAHRIRANGAVRWLKGYATTSTLTSTVWNYWSSSASPATARPSSLTRLSSLSAMGESSPYGFKEIDKYRRVSTVTTLSPVMGGGIFETIC